MHSAASLFFLAVFNVLRPGVAASHEPTRTKAGPADVCAIDPKSIVSDACASYATLDSLNSNLSPSLEALTKSTDFFAYYRLNLFNKECPYWSDATSMCGNRACAVDTLENEEDIPPIWRAEELSKLEGLHANHPGKQQQKERPKAKPLQGMLGEDVDESCVVEYDDECDERDYCVPEDEGATAKGDYVSLVNNTERFTGYAGPGARQVWDAIYSENCFPRPSSPSSPPSRSLPFGTPEAISDIRSVMQGYKSGSLGSRDEDLYPLDDECLEQRAFYRIISGMHASISTHICWDYFNQTTGEWVRNLECYKERLHEHPERISNLYFNYALVTRALAKLQKHLEHYTFCSGDPDQDFSTKQKVLELVSRIKSAPKTFNESLMFQDPAMLELKEDFRNRFRNVSRLMDCVGCDKCRLWGKLQTAGYGAALKVLFEFDETKNGENPHLRRTELVALVNTLARISHSLTAIQNFGAMLELEDRAAVSANTNNYPDEQELHEPAVPKEKMPVHQDEYEDFYDEDEDETERPLDKSLGQDFWDEINLVWRAYKYVLSSWISLPFKTWAIIVMELNRLWNYWLGLPVPPRSWDFHVPTRDEL